MSIFTFQQELPSAMQVIVFLYPVLSDISASRPSAARHSSSFQHYRQRYSDNAVLPGALSHLGLQAQCQLPIFPAGAIARDAVRLLRCPVLCQLRKRCSKHAAIPRICRKRWSRRCR